MDLLSKDKNIIIDVVNNLKKNKPEGGANFFDKIDEFVRDPKNIDMVYHIINKIKQDQGLNFNLIVTGKFGDWVYNLIKTGKIKINGIVIHVSGSLRSSIKNKTFQIIGGDENRVYNKNFILLDDSYYSGSTKREIEKHLNKYNAKIIKSYVFYDGGFQKKSDVYSVYRYYDYHSDNILPVKNLLNVLNNIDVNIPYNVIEDKIMKGQIRSIKELLKEIQILKNKFKNNNDIVKSYDYKMEYEKKNIKNYKNFLNENKDGEEDWSNESVNNKHIYTIDKFWKKYKYEGRPNMINYLKGKEIEFHTKSKKIEVYSGKIIGLLPIKSIRKNEIRILFYTKNYKTLEVDNNFPIIVKIWD